MDPLMIIGSILAAGASGLGLGVGARLVPVGLQASRDLRAYKHSPAAEVERRTAALERERRKLDSPSGRKRDSSIVGLYDDVLRRQDGSYTRVYDFALQNTFNAHEHVNEQFCDEIGRLLAVPKPPNTVMQYRYAVCPDPGRAIAAHLRSRGYERVYPPAARLHDSGVDFYKALADAGVFRTENASFNVTVPVTHDADDEGKGIGALVPAFTAEIKERGIKQFARAFTSARAGSRDDGVMRRLIECEREALDKAEKIFRRIEMQSPVALRRLDRNELWNAVFRSHCLNHSAVPQLGSLLGFDVRDYLCAETIENGGWYMLHGDDLKTPVAMVSMMRPGDPHFVATSMRALTAHPELTFRHTLVAEFIYLDQRKAVKALDRRTRAVIRTNHRADGKKTMTPEAKASLADLEAVREHVTGSSEALVQMRFYALVYGQPARTRAELKASLNTLEFNCEQIVTAMQDIEGVEAAVEEPSALRSLYQQTLLGEASAKPTGREFMEIANSLAAAVPAESTSRGSHRPHSLFSTTTARLAGVNLFDKSIIKSPLIGIFGEPGSGKTTLGARLINDSLASMPDLNAYIMDVGGSFQPYAESIGARYLRFDPNNPQPLNIFDYPGLAEGMEASTEDRSLMVNEFLTLCNVRESDDEASDIFAKAIKQVTINAARRNAPDRPKVEPTLSHLHAMLDAYDYGSNHLNERARALALKLERFVGDPFLDAETHPAFLTQSPCDIYELDSLFQFSGEIRNALAGRIAARGLMKIGKLRPDGTRTPLLISFVELWKMLNEFSSMRQLLRTAARQGRKENTVTTFEIHSYEELDGIHDLTATMGCKFIGLQTGDFPKLARDARLSPRTIAAINSIKNVDGEFTQWVMVAGSGQDQIVEMLQCDLSPAELWTFTTNPYERDARARVGFLKPEWSQSDAIAWLAAMYPRGLAAHGLIEIDESLLNDAA